MLNPWQAATLAAMRRYASRHGTRLIPRASLIAEELDRIASETGSVGRTPHQTLSRVLQELRNQEILEHVARGFDLLLDEPISADAADYPDAALDAALAHDKLRIVDVATGDATVLARRRRGQARLRAITLSNYNNQCGLCDVRSPDLIVASHIVRWADDPDAQGRLSNVICFCRMHDALFEAGYIKFDDDWRLLARNPGGSTVVSYLLATSKALRLPRSHPPLATYLHRHRMRVDGLIA